MTEDQTNLKLKAIQEARARILNQNILPTVAVYLTNQDVTKCEACAVGSLFVGLSRVKGLQDSWSESVKPMVPVAEIHEVLGEVFDPTTVILFEVAYMGYLPPVSTGTALYKDFRAAHSPEDRHDMLQKARQWRAFCGLDHEGRLLLLLDYLEAGKGVLTVFLPGKTLSENP